MLDRKVKVKSVLIWLTAAIVITGWTLGCVIAGGMNKAIWFVAALLVVFLILVLGCSNKNWPWGD